MIKDVALKQEAYAVMRGYVGVRELTGNNDGEQIGKAQKLMGLTIGSAKVKGDPYCAAMIVCAFTVALAKHFDVDPRNERDIKAQVLPHVGSMIPVSASVMEMHLQARERGLWRPNPRTRWENGYTPAQGDLVCFHFRGSGNHIGMVEAITGEEIHTIEANTSPVRGTAESNDPRGGVFRKVWKRSDDAVWGFIRIPERVALA